MKNKISLLLFFLTLFSLSSFAQTGNLKWRQIEHSTQGKIPIVGSDGIGAWTDPPFPKWTDTLGGGKVATKYEVSLSNGKEITNAGFSGGTLTLTKVNGGTVTVGLDGRYIPATEKAAVNGVAPLGADGKVPNAYLPAQSVSDVFVVSSQSAMLALAATQGDFAIRSDENKTYVLQQAPATTLSNWIELPQGTGITSVNSKTGPAVTLTTDDISEGTINLYLTATRVRNALSATGDINLNVSTGAITHVTSGVTPGTYNSVTVNANGHVTSASNVTYLTASDLTPYETKANLAASGSSAVHWNNITNKPSNIGLQFAKDRFTSSTSSVKTLTQTPAIPSAAAFYLNGQLIDTADYSLSGTTLTLGFSIASSDIITGIYPY